MYHWRSERISEYNWEHIFSRFFNEISDTRKLHSETNTKFPLLLIFTPFIGTEKGKAQSLVHQYLSFHLSKILTHRSMLLKLLSETYTMAYQDQDKISKRVRVSSLVDIYNYMDKEQGDIINKERHLRHQ